MYAVNNIINHEAYYTAVTTNTRKTEGDNLYCVVIFCVDEVKWDSHMIFIMS